MFCHINPLYQSKGLCGIIFVAKTVSEVSTGIGFSKILSKHNYFQAIILQKKSEFYSIISNTVVCFSNFAKPISSFTECKEREQVAEKSQFSVEREPTFFMCCEPTFSNHYSKHFLGDSQTAKVIRSRS